MDLKVIIWGIGRFNSNNISNNATQYIQWIEETNIEIVLFVDKYLNNTVLNNIPVISEKEYYKQQNQYKSYKVIPIGRTTSTNKSAFLTTLKSIFFKHNFKSCNISHPILLSHFSKIDLSDKSILFGERGTGSTLISTIMEELKYKKNIQPNSDTKKKYTDLIISESKEIIKDTLNGIFPINNYLQYNLSFKNLNYIDLTIIEKSSFTKITIPSKYHYMLEDKIKTNSIPTTANINTLLASNATIFVVIRNPIDIIISVASKLHSSTLLNIENYKIKANDIKKQINSKRLRNLDWFRNYANYLKEYFTLALNNKERINFIKYETLILEPISVIKNIGDKMDAKVTLEEIEILWDKYGFKKLCSFNETHLNKPKDTNRALNYLNKEHILILQELGYENLLTKLNYSNKALNIEQYIKNNLYSDKETSLFDDSLSLFDESIAMKNNIYIPIFKSSKIKTKNINNCKIVSNNNDMIEQFENGLKNPINNTILNSFTF